MMVLFGEIATGFQLLIFFAKSSMLDVRMGSEYASVEHDLCSQNVIR